MGASPDADWSTIGQTVDEKVRSFLQDLFGPKAEAEAIQVTGWDIDDVTETVLLINDQEVELPAEIVADVAPKTVTIELEDDLLKEGEDTITFVFAEAVGGTTGFSILDVKSMLRE